MKIITAEEKVAALAPSCALLKRCGAALTVSDYLGAVVPIESTDREEDIEIARTALYLAGWLAEPVAEYPPGQYTPNDNGDKLRVSQRLTGARPAGHTKPSGGGH